MGVLKGQVALVTGAGRGIGRAAAIALAEAGADVVVNYRSSREQAEEVAQACRDAGAQAHLVQADVANQQAVQHLIAEAVEHFGKLDIAVANAAYSDRERFHEADMQGFERTIQVTMWGAFYLLRAAARQMIYQGHGGSVVVVSSPHAYIPIPGSMAYNMAKGAVDQMAKTAACELAEHRIRVNMVHPGWIDTPGERKFFSEEELQTRGGALPWGRLGKPSEIGRGIVFLCDPGSDYVTGSSLLIDGGIQLPFQEMHRLKEGD